MLRKKITRLVAIVALLSSTSVLAVQFDNRSFEQGGLSGWEHIGDASVQDNGLGIDPTHGRNAALLTTSMPPPNKAGYGTEYGTGSLEFLRWLGLPPLTFPDLPPEWIEWSAWQEAGNLTAEIGGHSGIRQSVRLRAGDQVSFDWNRVGDSVDRAFAILYPSSGPFYRGIYAELTAPFLLPNTMNPWICTSGNPDDPDCIYQTGWQGYSYVAPSDGDYTLVLGVFDRMDDGWLAALWLDDFRISRVPEPGVLSLLAVCFAGLAIFVRNQSSDRSVQSFRSSHRCRETT